MTGMAIGVIPGQIRCGRHLGLVSGRLAGARVLVLVVTEMCTACFMLANARGCGPTPLERQQEHHENDNEAAHESARSLATQACEQADMSDLLRGLFRL